MSNSAALDELFASNIAGQIYYITLEFNHSAFRDSEGNPTAIRLVQGFDPLTATLEADAPYDASTSVLFQPAAIDVELPVKNVEGRHDMRIILDAASGEIIRQLELVAAAPREAIRVLFREFISSDLSGPQSTPLRMTVINPQVTATRVTATATFADLVNKSFPSINYTLRTHPGLAG